MPHIIIEYSANVADQHDIETLVDVVHAAALDHGLASPDALRTRAEKRIHYHVADNDPNNAFVAVHVRVGPGRETEAKQSFIKHILDAAENHLDTDCAGDKTTSLAIAWSIELKEIDPTLRINRNHVRTRMQQQKDTGK